MESKEGAKFPFAAWPAAQRAWPLLLGSSFWGRTEEEEVGIVTGWHWQGVGRGAAPGTGPDSWNPPGGAAGRNLGHLA